ncbi:MAG: hypothetical protein ACKVP5_02115 [Aestuariivirga sp.]
MRAFPALLAAAFLLAACNNDAKGVRFVNGVDRGSPDAQPVRALSDAEIRTAIAGKTFQYTRSDGSNGFVTYNGDGTFTFEDDTKGAGTGQWSASSGQFCEVFGAGAPRDCGEFKNTGDAFFAAKSRLVEMKG